MLNISVLAIYLKELKLQEQYLRYKSYGYVDLVIHLSVNFDCCNFVSVVKQASESIPPYSIFLIWLKFYYPKTVKNNKNILTINQT